jgi:hypothetical protein
MKDKTMIRNTIAALLVALALPAAAQSIPAANYSDIWWNPSESGWGVTFTQHPTSNQVFAVWYTYDPRAPDAASPGNFKPLWLVMPGGLRHAFLLRTEDDPAPAVLVPSRAWPPRFSPIPTAPCTRWARGIPNRRSA